MRLSVFCGVSVDGFLARPDDALDFLHTSEQEPHGFKEFLASVDVVVLGRRTFDVDGRTDRNRKAAQVPRLQTRLAQFDWRDAAATARIRMIKIHCDWVSDDFCCSSMFGRS
jgi:dihydrofolate reductase